MTTGPLTFGIRRKLRLEPGPANSLMDFIILPSFIVLSFNVKSLHTCRASVGRKIFQCHANQILYFWARRNRSPGRSRGSRMPHSFSITMEGWYLIWAQSSRCDLGEAQYWKLDQWNWEIQELVGQMCPSPGVSWTLGCAEGWRDNVTVPVCFPLWGHPKAMADHLSGGTCKVCPASFDWNEGLMWAACPTQHPSSSALPDSQGCRGKSPGKQPWQSLRLC